ncbi:MAG TPA: PIN domain-containing protein [Sediminibacterium sp.]|uniref:PIN domain-containing protein n=2 Tax=Sediminibacterium sp. TaxID=1917865 RepID=UPI002CE8287D|nr:PIN domain-containing protein [Sediminibacterium sp.]HQS35613.1 PIN domain-containing protein [Sediminibacterium sp.]
MLNIILDTNIILRQPKVLGLKIPDIHFLIPLNVIEELNTRANSRGVSSDKRIDLIQKASEDGTISIINTDLPLYRQFSERFQANNLSNTDIAILAMAVDFKMKEQDVKIASLDKEIINFASTNGIEVLDNSGIENLIINFSEQTNKSSTALKEEILTYERSERKTLIVEILIGVLVTVFAYLIFKNIGKIVATIQVWGTITLILISGVALFVFRERRRLSYGVVEFLVGALAIIILFQPDNFNLSKVKFNFEFILKIFAGLYIMVRGQDNIIKAIKVY